MATLPAGVREKKEQEPEVFSNLRLSKLDTSHFGMLRSWIWCHPSICKLAHISNEEVHSVCCDLELVHQNLTASVLFESISPWIFSLTRESQRSKALASGAKG